MARTYKPVPQKWVLCAVCNEPVKGNAKRRYCSNRCRSAARRARQAPSAKDDSSGSQRQ